MDLDKIRKELESKELSKESIVRLIDIKIDNDMDRVLTQIDKSNSRFESANSRLEAAIESLKAENSSIKWVIGISSGAIAVLITILGLVFTFKK